MHRVLPSCSSRRKNGDWHPEPLINTIADARLVLREDANIERHDYLASRLQTLDTIVQKSVKAGQFNNAIGALKLQSELLGLNKQ